VTFGGLPAKASRVYFELRENFLGGRVIDLRAFFQRADFTLSDADAIQFSCAPAVEWESAPRAFGVGIFGVRVARGAVAERAGWREKMTASGNRLDDEEGGDGDGHESE
jgi:hypothetical protein